MPPAHTGTQTYIQLRCLQNRLQPQFNPKKKTAPSASQIAAPAATQRSALLSSTLSLVLFFIGHCISWGAGSADCCDCSCSLLSRCALSHSLSSFLPHPKGFLFSFPFTVLLLWICWCYCYLGCFLCLLLPSFVSSAVFGFCFSLLCKVCHFFVLFLHFLATSACNTAWRKDLSEWWKVVGKRAVRGDWDRHRTIVSFAWKPSVNYPETI